MLTNSIEQNYNKKFSSSIKQFSGPGSSLARPLLRKRPIKVHRKLKQQLDTLNLGCLCETYSAIANSMRLVCF